MLELVVFIFHKMTFEPGDDYEYVTRCLIIQLIKLVVNLKVVLKVDVFNMGFVPKQMYEKRTFQLLLFLIKLIYTKIQLLINEN
jgi:hypothetical protein